MNVITIETVKHYDKTLDKTSFSISNNFFFRTHPYFKPYYGERPPSKFAKAARWIHAVILYYAIYKMNGGRHDTITLRNSKAVQDRTPWYVDWNE